MFLIAAQILVFFHVSPSPVIRKKSWCWDSYKCNIAESTSSHNRRFAVVDAQKLGMLRRVGWTSPESLISTSKQISFFSNGKLCDSTWSNAGRSWFFSPSSRAGRSRAKLLQTTVEVSRHLTIHSLKEIPIAATPKDMASTIRVPYVADTVPDMIRSKLIIGL